MILCCAWTVDSYSYKLVYSEVMCGSAMILSALMPPSFPPWSLCQGSPNLPNLPPTAFPEAI